MDFDLFACPLGLPKEEWLTIDLGISPEKEKFN